MPTQEINPVLYFDNVEDALSPLSAGSETKICVYCCPCGTNSGETVSRVNTPHPTWTNLSGKAVVLMDAVVLGGPNGLNN